MIQSFLRRTAMGNGIIEKGTVIKGFDGVHPGLVFQLNDPDQAPSTLIIAVDEALRPYYGLGGTYELALTRAGEHVSFLSFRTQSIGWASAPFNPHLTGTPPIRDLAGGEGLPLILMRVNVTGGVVEDSEYMVLGHGLSEEIIKASNAMLEKGFDMSLFEKEKISLFERFPKDDDIAAAADCRDTMKME